MQRSARRTPLRRNAKNVAAFGATLLAFVSATAHAEERSLTAGVRVFTGARAEGAQELEGGYGALALLGVPFFRHFVLEGSVGVADTLEGRPFLLTELVGKWEFESETPVHPHLALGPVLSLDLGEEIVPEAGVVGAFGVTSWVRPRFGVTTDVAYRFLAGEELSHIGTMSFGVVWRLR